MHKLKTAIKGIAKNKVGKIVIKRANPLITLKPTNNAEKYIYSKETEIQSDTNYSHRIGQRSKDCSFNNYGTIRQGNKLSGMGYPFIKERDLFNPQLRVDEIWKLKTDKSNREYNNESLMLKNRFNIDKSKLPKNKAEDFDIDMFNERFQEEKEYLSEHEIIEAENNAGENYGQIYKRDKESDESSRKPKDPSIGRKRHNKNLAITIYNIKQESDIKDKVKHNSNKKLKGEKSNFGTKKSKPTREIEALETITIKLEPIRGDLKKQENYSNRELISDNLDENAQLVGSKSKKEIDLLKINKADTVDSNKDLADNKSRDKITEKIHHKKRTDKQSDLNRMKKKKNYADSNIKHHPKTFSLAEDSTIPVLKNLNSDRAIEQNNDEVSEIYNRTKEPIREAYIRKGQIDERLIKDHAMDVGGFNKRRYQDMLNFSPSDYTDLPDHIKPLNTIEKIETTYDYMINKLRRPVHKVKEKIFESNSEFKGDKKSNDKFIKENADSNKTGIDEQSASHKNEATHHLNDSVMSKVKNLGHKVSDKLKNKLRTNQNQTPNQKDTVKDNNVLKQYSHVDGNYKSENIRHSNGKTVKFNVQGIHIDNKDLPYDYDKTDNRSVLAEQARTKHDEIEIRNQSNKLPMDNNSSGYKDEKATIVQNTNKTQAF